MHRSASWPSVQTLKHVVKYLLWNFCSVLGTFLIRGLFVLPELARLHRISGASLFYRQRAGYAKNNVIVSTYAQACFKGMRFISIY